MKFGYRCMRHPTEASVVQRVYKRQRTKRREAQNLSDSPGGVGTPLELDCNPFGFGEGNLLGFDDEWE